MKGELQIRNKPFFWHTLVIITAADDHLTIVMAEYKVRCKRILHNGKDHQNIEMSKKDKM